MKELMELVQEARSAGDCQRLVDLVPYARMLGMKFSVTDKGLLFELPFRKDLVGNYLLPAIHGGVVAAFMEHSALLQILWNQESVVLPKVVDFSIDYLRPARAETTFVNCSVIRQGQRIANVAASAWQGRPENMVATARMHFLLTRQEDDTAR